LGTLVNANTFAWNNATITEMGIYYATYFFRNLAQRTGKIQLASLNPILETKDIQRGWVSAKELMQYFGPPINNKLKHEDLVRGCGLVQILATSLVENDEGSVQYELPVNLSE
jgi:hypothetical protein